MYASSLNISHGGCRTCRIHWKQLSEASEAGYESDSVAKQHIIFYRTSPHLPWVSPARAIAISCQPGSLTARPQQDKQSRKVLQ